MYGYSYNAVDMTRPCTLIAAVFKRECGVEPRTHAGTKDYLVVVPIYRSRRIDESSSYVVPNS